MQMQNDLLMKLLENKSKGNNIKLNNINSIEMNSNIIQDIKHNPNIDQNQVNIKPHVINRFKHTREVVNFNLNNNNSPIPITPTTPSIPVKEAESQSN